MSEFMPVTFCPACGRDQLKPSPVGLYTCTQCRWRFRIDYSRKLRAGQRPPGDTTEANRKSGGDEVSG